MKEKKKWSKQMMNRQILKKQAVSVGKLLRESAGEKGKGILLHRTEEETDQLYVYIMCMLFLKWNGWIEGCRLEDRESIADALRKMQIQFPEIFVKDVESLLKLLPESTAAIEELSRTVLQENGGRDVQIIGRLYQYYHCERKEKIFSGFQQNRKVTKETLPTATQFFTPSEITDYMTQNTLGRYWLSQHPESELRERWKVYSGDEALSGGSAKALQEITCIDPCCGSGNVLCGLFDMLMEIYESDGNTPEAAARSILEHNLFGLDIDSDVVMISRFSLLMKAAFYDSTIILSGIVPQVYALTDYTGSGIDEMLQNAGEYGSLLRPEKKTYILNVNKNRKQCETLKAFSLLTEKYDVVITNPPYMGKKHLSTAMHQFLDRYYPKGKSELYAAFILRCTELASENGFVGMVTIHSWMFLSSFSALREELLQKTRILTLLHTGAGTFEDLNSFNVLSAVFCLQKSPPGEHSGIYTDLTKYNSFAEKWEHLSDDKNIFRIQQKEFEALPGKPLVYSLPDAALKNYFSGKPIREYARPRQGMATGRNADYVRFWYEVGKEKTGFGCHDKEEARQSGCRWFPYNKGGNYRKWYGDTLYVVDWKDDGKALKAEKNAVIRNEETYFREGITWSLFGFENFSVRYKPCGYLYDVSGSSMFPDKKLTAYILGFLSSKAAFLHLSKLAPTVNFQVGNIGDLPLIVEKKYMDEIDQLVNECISLAKEDACEDELSPEYAVHPMLCRKGTVRQAYAQWREECEKRCRKMKENEEALNRIFIRIYGLEQELTPEVKEKNITLRHPDSRRDMISFISYAVGCMLGRYQTEGYHPEQRFCVMTEEGILEEFCHFVQRVYGKESYQENLEAIGYALDSSTEDPLKTIGQYLFSEFYTDHIRQYHKHPVYIMFTSGKNSRLRILVYVHHLNREVMKQICQIASDKAEQIPLRNNARAVSAAEELKSFAAGLEVLDDEHWGYNSDDGLKVLYEKLDGLIVKIR